MKRERLKGDCCRKKQGQISKLVSHVKLEVSKGAIVIR